MSGERVFDAAIVDIELPNIVEGTAACVDGALDCIESAESRDNLVACGAALAYQAGNFLTDALAAPYEAALLSNIVHGLGTEECAALLRRLMRRPRRSARSSGPGRRSPRVARAGRSDRPET